MVVAVTVVEAVAPTAEGAEVSMVAAVGASSGVAAVGVLWAGVAECDPQASLAAAVLPLIAAVRLADPADFPPDVRLA